jgi:hypothetical protein
MQSKKNLEISNVSLLSLFSCAKFEAGVCVYLCFEGYHTKVNLQILYSL